MLEVEDSQYLTAKTDLAQVHLKGQSQTYLAVCIDSVSQCDDFTRVEAMNTYELEGCVTEQKSRFLLSFAEIYLRIQLYCV